MKNTRRLSNGAAAACALGLAAALAATAASAAGFTKLSSSGASVLATCNPGNSSSNTNCRVTSLPGESGYTQTASRSSPLVINDITVGTVYEKVWRNCADSTLYIVGTQVVLNANAWDESGVAFRVSDLFRRSLPDSSVSVAYYIDTATVALKYGGRTVQGAGEYSGSQPERDNTWADFRIDANGSASSSGAKKSPWVLVKTQAPDGLAIDPFGVRTLNSTAADPTEILSTGYQPNGLPDEGGDD